MDFIGVFKEIYPTLLNGLVLTLEVTVLALLIAIVLGFVSSLMGMSKIKPLAWLSKLYVWIIRGTPFIVQLFIIKYGIPYFIRNLGGEFNLSIFSAALIALSLNAGAYISEIFRGGIQAVDKGQIEAARSLGLPQGRTTLKIVLPQALRICIPSLCNQFIITLKDSSLAQCIGLQEMFCKATIYVGRTYKSFEAYVIVGLFYLIIITILSRIIKIVERKLSND